MHLLLLILIGTSFGLEKRQSEHPIREHLIPQILTAETPEWKITEEELRFGENAPTAVVVPAAEDTPLQVARNGPHVFVTNDKVIDSPLKFISHHHPSLRTVDLSALVDNLNFIFAAPHRHQIQEQQDWGSAEEGQERSAQFDVPKGSNASGNPFESTVLVLPDGNPVKKYLQELQDKIKMREQQGNQTQTQQQEDGNLQERSAQQGVFIPYGNSQGIFVPLQPTTSFINNQPAHTQFPQQQTTFVNHPFFRALPEGQERSAQFDLPEGLNASGNPFESTVLILPDDSPVKKHLKELQDKMNQTQERSAAMQGNPALSIPTKQDFLQPDTSFIKHQPAHTQFPQQKTTVVNERDSQQFQEGLARSAQFDLPEGLNASGNPFESTVLILPDDNPVKKHLKELQDKMKQQSNQTADTQTQQERTATFLGNRGLFIPNHQQFLQPSTSFINQQPVQSLPIAPGFAQFPQQQTTFINQPFFRDSEQEAKAAEPTHLHKHKKFHQPPSAQSYQSVAAPFLVDAPERRDRFRWKRFTRSSENLNQPGLDHKLPSDNMISHSSLEDEDSQELNNDLGYFDFLSEEDTTIPKMYISEQDTGVPKIFPSMDEPCRIPVIIANSPNGAPLTKPSDEPFFACIDKTKVRFTDSDRDIKECVGYTTRMCPPVKHIADEALQFFHASGARSAQIDLEEVVGPLSIFQFTNQDNGDEISIVDLEEVFPGEMRASKAEPLQRHHGTHFFLHQHGFVPNQGCQGAVVTPTQQIPYLATKVNAGFGLVHQQLTPTQSQSVQISGNGNGVSQSQAVVHANPGNLFNGGQNVYISGAGNSVSQSQNQNSQIHASGNSVALSQNVQRNRRSLVELVNDPNVKLDVPKTISNIGTVAKTSFHDQKQPMYHLNNMGLIIPSHYRIVNAAELDDNDLEAKHEITRSINEDLLPNSDESHNFNQEPNDNPLTDTFNKFGSALRQSIQAGQQTLAHVGDIAHSARQVVHTAKSAAPQIFLPRHQKNPDKVMLVTPKLLETKNADQAQNTRDFVKMGDLLDALSVSNPNESNLGIEKIVIERKNGQRKPLVVDRSKGADESNLKEFVSKMKGEFDSLLKEKLKQDREARRLTKTISKLERKNDNVRAKQPFKLDSVLGQVQDHVDIMKSKSNQVIETIQDVNGKFINTLRTLGGSKTTPKDDLVGVTHIILPKNFPTTPKPTARLKSTQDEPDDWDKQVSSFLTELFEEKTPEEMVGAPQFSRNSLNLRPDLMKPFMGRASLKKLMKQRKLVGEEVVGSSKADEKEMEKIRQAQKVLGAVNPLMFEKLFNETMSGSDGKSLSPYDVFTAGRNFTEMMQVCHDPTKERTSMKITRELLKPFMGLKGNRYMKVVPVQNNEEEEEVYYMEE